MKSGSDPKLDSELTAASSARQEGTRFFARIFLGVSLSILLHVIVSVLAYEFSQLIEAPKPRPAALIEWIEPSDIKKEDWAKSGNQVVRKADLPKDLLELGLKTKRRFASEDEQTVKKEMRAAASGMTENRAESLDLSASRSAQRAVQAQKQNDAKETEIKQGPVADRKQLRRGPRERLPEVVPNSIFTEGLGDIEVEIKKERESGASGQQARELVLPSDPRRNRGISTNGDELPKDIQIGDFTALNTDRFIYYTYYARIEEAIRHRWVRYVKAAIFGGGDISPGQRQFETNVEIVLNREGDFERAILHQGSGSRDIDAAGILAFREAKRIPHPPREMVKDDGTIRLFYSFHVDSLPPMARAPTPRTAAGAEAE